MPVLTITKTWQALIPAGVEFLLTSRRTALIELYPMPDAVTAPTVAEGHTLDPSRRESINRTLIGTGAIWIRISPDEAETATTAVLSTWS